LLKHLFQIVDSFLTRFTRQCIAKLLRCDVVFNNRFIIHLLLSPMVRKFWKSVNIWRSYKQE